MFYTTNGDRKLMRSMTYVDLWIKSSVSDPRASQDMESGYKHTSVSTLICVWMPAMIVLPLIELAGAHTAVIVLSI